MDELNGIRFQPDRSIYWSAVATHVVGDTWVEFGVASGRSCKYWLEALTGTLYCFDSWKGLPESWDKGAKVMQAGAFSQPVPAFLKKDPRVVIVEGWLKDTLPYEFPGPLSFCHIDTDLYSSACTILERVDPYLVDGTVIMFDEMWNDGGNHYPTWEQGEYKAYSEWKERTGKSVEWFLSTVGGSAGYIRE